MGTLRSAEEEAPIGAGHWRELVVLLPSVCPHRHVQSFLVQDAQPSIQTPKGWALVRRKDLVL